ncbi:TonB family protein [Nannocystis pusilla]|uniref:TonB family protein n=1 Tax=Nannocystis pusilla TaxID=889268 RepID=UPI003B777229
MGLAGPRRARGRPPSPRTRVDAVYPLAEARSDVVAVELAVTVEADGRVGAVEVLKSGGAAFDDAAVAAVKQWRFDPARRDDVAVAVKIRVPFNFAPPAQPAEAPAGEPAPSASQPGPSQPAPPDSQPGPPNLPLRPASQLHPNLPLRPARLNLSLRTARPPRQNLPLRPASPSRCSTSPRAAAGRRRGPPATSWSSATSSPHRRDRAPPTC